MPALPQVLFSLPAEVTVPSFSFPAEIELPSLDSVSIDWERIKELFAAFFRDMSAAASNGATWVREHPEEIKHAGLIFAACVVLALTLYALVPAVSALLGALFQLVFGVLQLVHQLVLLPLNLVLNIITGIINGVLRCLGFTPSGVRSHSLASRGQSALYGPNTGGFFSSLQSAGARRR